MAEWVATHLAQLKGTPDIVRSLVNSVTREGLRWRPANGGWSMHEVVCHLVDEELDDFPVRLLSTLTTPDEPWPAIDPEGWVTQRNYDSRDTFDQVNQFSRERNFALERLADVTNPDWALTYTRDGRSISAGDLLTAWAAHDLHHVRQLCRLSLEYLEDLSPFSPAYAL